MNSKVAKYLKKLADGLPEIIVETTKRVQVLGCELPPEAVNELGDKYVPSGKFLYNMTTKAPADHYATMKKLHQVQGQAAVERYCETMRNYNAVLQQRKEAKAPVISMNDNG